MKITKYPQSCLLIEKDNQKIVIDPGGPFAAKYTADEFGEIMAVLYTHQHGDHYDPKIAATLHGHGVELFGNESTARLIGDHCKTIYDGDEFDIGDFHIKAYEVPHCLMGDGSPGPQNTGYVIDETFLHPGDGKALVGLQVDTLAMPINGPDISMLDAFNFARQVGAKVAIPIHYDVFREDPKLFREFAAEMHMPFEVRVLASGESLEV